MSKYVTIAVAGYMAGMYHKRLCRELCWPRMKKRAHRLMKML